MGEGANTRVQLIQPLETILYEVGRMDNLVDAVDDLLPEERAVIKRELAALHDRADRFFT